MFTTSLMGGYDDNLMAAQGLGLGSGLGLGPTDAASGTIGNLDATLGYFRGTSSRSIRVDSTGSLLAFPGYLDRPAAGATTAISARTTAGRNTTLGASQRAGYEPFFNAFSPGASSAPLQPGVDPVVPTASLFERRSLTSDSSVSLDRRWGRLDSTSLSYSYGVRQFIDDDAGDSTSHTAAAGYRRAVATGVRARADYRYADIQFAGGGDDVWQTRNHRMEGGVETQNTLSRRRHLTTSLTAGAAYVEASGSRTGQPYGAWVPTGSGDVRLALSPSWFVEGGYRRDFSLLQGLTDEVYLNDTASLATGGSLTARTDVRVGATYGNWRTPIASGVTDTFNVYGASLVVRRRLTNSLAATAGYFYYHHRFATPGGLPEGFPAEFDRNAVRVGVSWRFPLLGTPAQQAAGR